MFPFTVKGSTLLLIGPQGMIVAEVGDLLASQLHKPLVRLWEFTHKYSEEIGFSSEHQHEVAEQNGFEGSFHYMQPFFAHTIKRVVQKHKGSIIAVGPLQSTVEDSETLNELIEQLKPYDVVLLRPTADDKESVEILQQQRRVVVYGKEMNEHFLSHHSNSDLAKYTFYTKGKSPEQTVDEILEQVNAEASDIILIGAMGVGKSTIGKLLSSKLNLPQVSMDKHRWTYYKEKDWTEERQEEIDHKEGFAGVYKYWKQYDVHAVERLLEEHKNCVIDFGAGHSIYENAEDFARVSDLLSPYQNVVLLLPSPDLDESFSILEDRRANYVDGVELTEYLVTHPSSRALADVTVFTEHKTPSEIVSEILARVDVTANSTILSRLFRR